MSEIWYRDLHAWVRNRCTFFPTTQMHLREQMNAVVRFAPDSIALTLVTRRVGTMRIFVARGGLLQCLSRLRAPTCGAPRSPDGRETLQVTGTASWRE
jgi:hypothetical protein